MTEVIIMVLMTIFIVLLVVVAIFEFKYIKFLMNRQFFILENVEKIRDEFINYEESLYTFTRNPVIQLEMDYKRVVKHVSEIKSIMAEFEDFYQALPERKEDKNE